MQILMDIVNKQQSQIAELVKSKAGQVSQSLIDEVNDTERLAHHQSQLMNGLGANHVNCLQLEQMEGLEVLGFMLILDPYRHVTKHGDGFWWNRCTP